MIPKAKQRQKQYDIVAEQGIHLQYKITYGSRGIRKPDSSMQPNKWQIRMSQPSVVSHYQLEYVHQLRLIVQTTGEKGIRQEKVRKAGSVADT